MSVGGIGKQVENEAAGAAAEAGAPAAPAEAPEAPEQAAAPPSAEETQRAWGMHAADPSAAAWRAKLGDTSAAVAKARVVAEPSLGERFAGWVRGVGRDIGEAGATLSSSAQEVSGKLAERAEAGLRAAGGAAQVLGQEVESLPGRAVNLRNDLRELAHRAVEVGDRGLRAVEDGFESLEERAGALGRDTAEALGRTLDGAERAARRVIDAGRSLYDSVVNTLDPLEKVKELDSEGDTFTIALGGEVDVEATISAQGSLECKRAKDGYEVTIAGKAAVGVVGELGVELGADGKAEARASVGAGGAVTMKFATAEEAARAIRIAERAALAGAAGGAVAGPLGTAAATRLLGPSDDDYRFLADHAASVKLTGTAAASVAADLGVGLGADMEALGIKGEAGVEENFSVKIDLPKGSEPAKLTLTGDIALKAKAGASAGLADLGLEGLGLKGEVSGELKASIERSYRLPRSIDVDGLRRRPGATIASMAREIAATEEAKVKVSGKLTGTGGLDFPGLPKGIAPAANASGTVEVAAEIAARPSELGPRLREAIRGGDMRALLGALDERAKVSASVSTATSHGIKLAPSLSGFGIGGKALIQYERKDRTDLWKAEGRPSEMLERLRQLGRPAPIPEPPLRLAVAGAPG